MSEKQRPIEVKGSPSRCPYCHDDVSPEESAAAVCRACLARHHSSCWSSHGACATCNATDRLEPGAPAEVTPQAARNALQRSGLSKEALEALVVLAQRAEGQGSSWDAEGRQALAKVLIVVALSVGSGLLTGALVDTFTRASTGDARLVGTAVGLLVAGFLGFILVATRRRS